MGIPNQDDELNVDLYSDEELHPYLVVFTDNVRRFSPYKKQIEESGFTCHIHSDVQEVLTIAGSRKGAIVFFSWDIKGIDVKKTTALLQEKTGAHIIVFTESDAVQVRAKISSSGFKQIIQPPFSEKNLLMAAQKVVSDRLLENEKWQRKLKHLERQNTGQESQPGTVQPAGAFHLVEERQVVFASKTTEVIKGETSPKSNAQVFSGEPSKKHFIHNKGADSKSHLHIVKTTSGEKTPRDFKPLTQQKKEVAEEVINWGTSSDNAHPFSSGDWKSVELPPLPKLPADMQVNFSTSEKAITKETFSKLDLALLIGGGLIGLVVCFYILANVFLFP